MWFLSGGISASLAGQPNTGYMLSPGMGNRVPADAVWAADNGCFAGVIDLDRQLRFLERHQAARSRCLFAVLPDVLEDAAATAVASYAAIERLWATGYPLAFVLQPGVRVEQVPWSEVRAVFVGGRHAAWKFSAEAMAVVDAARERGKWTHMGRVNTRGRILAAKWAGFDSVDGTTVARAPDIYVDALRRWMGEANAQPVLFERTIRCSSDDAL